MTEIEQMLQTPDVQLCPFEWPLTTVTSNAMTSDTPAMTTLSAATNLEQNAVTAASLLERVRRADRRRDADGIGN